MTFAAAVGCGTSQLKLRQQDSLQAIVDKHVQDPALRELNSSQTSTERGVQRWEQAHLVSALDVINEYQRSRRARVFGGLGDFAPSWRRSYKNDPRTRMCELLKSWLRANAGSTSLPEEEVRNMCGLCRDILSHPQLFKARNPQSFLKSMADVYDHLQWQLQEVLEKDRSCAELAQRLIMLSKNLIADTVAYLMLAPTDLKDTDGLPSLEVVKLWQALPDEGHPMPHRKDPALQKLMGEAWDTRCGAMIAALLRAPWCVRLFAGADAENTARLAALEDGEALQQASFSLPTLLRQARAAFQSGNYKGSGLVGALRGEQNQQQREILMQAVAQTSDIMYLLGEVIIQFHRIGDGLGDYGMIRVAPWLHPILDALLEKVQQLKSSLEQLNNGLDSAYVLARARGQKIQKPAPTDKMCARARDAIQRAFLAGGSSHSGQLLQLAEELRSRSAPERLPHLAKGLGDACMTLSEVLASPEFRRHVGNGFPQLPALADLGAHPRLEKALTTERAETRALTWQGPNPEEAVDQRPSEKSRRGLQPIEGMVQRARTDSKGKGPPFKLAVMDADLLQDTASTSATPRTMMRENSQSCSSCYSAQSVGIPISGPVLTFEVNRLTSVEPLKRHDRRRIEIQEGELLIYSTGSQSRIKSAVQLPEGVDRVFLLSDTVLEACFSLTPVDALPGGGVVRPKDYIFEFSTPEQADIFCEELWHQGVR